MRGDVDPDDYERSASVKDRSADLTSAVLLRLAPPVAIALGCIYLIRAKFEDLTFNGVVDALAATAPSALALAIMFAALSLVAISCYDMIALPAMNARARRPLYAPWPRLLRGGFAGAVFAQSLGLGVLTGAVARARVYRANGFRAYQAGVLSLIASLGFIGGGAVFASLIALIAPEALSDPFDISAEGVRLAAFATLTVAISIAALRGGDGRTLGQTMRSLGLFTLFAGVDLIFAALAFSMLLPPGAAPDPVTLIAVFAFATVAGHLSSAPGGVGPFEAIMLACLAASPSDAVLAAILAYRLIYHAAPLIPAMALVIFAPRSPVASLAEGEELRDRVDWAIDVSDNPEAELARLGDKRIYQPRLLSGFVMYGVSGRVWLALGDPIGPEREWGPLIDGLAEEAHAVGATLAAYKATPRSLPLWRDRGMAIAPYGEEARLSAPGFSLEGSAMRELRRKLRKVERNEIEIRFHDPGEAPLDALADVADAWAMSRRDPELRFSMGCWRPDFTRGHRIFSAWREDAPVAFISCWRSGDGETWMLDLIRQTPDAPSGAVHALVVAAIDAAAASGASDFNLCMAPLSGLDRGDGAYARLGARLYDKSGERYGLHGMRRFKSTFRPVWTPRYVVARNGLAMVEALVAARRLVRGDDVPDWDMPRSPRLRSYVALLPTAKTSESENGVEALAPVRRRA